MWFTAGCHCCYSSSQLVATKPNQRWMPLGWNKIRWICQILEGPAQQRRSSEETATLKQENCGRELFQLRSGRDNEWGMQNLNTTHPTPVGCNWIPSIGQPRHMLLELDESRGIKDLGLSNHGHIDPREKVGDPRSPLGNLTYLAKVAPWTTVSPDFTKVSPWKTK